MFKEDILILLWKPLSDTAVFDSIVTPLRQGFEYFNGGLRI